MFRGKSRVKDITQKRVKISNIFITFFLIFQCCFGLNFGFLAIVKEKYRSLLKFVSQIAIVVMTTILTLSIFRPNNLNSWYYLIDLAYFVLFAIFTTFNKYTVYQFIIDIQNIHAFNNNIDIFTMVYTTLCFLVKFALCLVYCDMKNDCYANMLPEYVFCIPSLALDMLPILATVILYYAYVCLSNLREKSVNLDSLSKKYIALANCYDQVKPTYGILMLLLVLTNVPRLMVMIYNTILYFKTYENWVSTATQALFTCHVVFQLTVPALVGEMIDSEVEALKLKLNNQLMNGTGADSETKLLRLLRYMDARPLKHRVYRLMWIDLSLPMSIFSFCVTYMIVIIQFTHLDQ